MEDKQIMCKEYWVCNMYSEENLTIEEIADALKLPQQEVYRILKKEGLV